LYNSKQKGNMKFNQKISALDQLFIDTEQCCNIAGQTQSVDIESKLQQFDIIQEEVKELLTAIGNHDLTEQLDACVDTLVTVFGFMLKLQQQGADLDKAMIKTGANNLTKFPIDRDVAEATIQKYKNKGINVGISFNPMYNRWVIKDTNGKYKKPVGFVDNDLTDCFIKEK